MCNKRILGSCILTLSCAVLWSSPPAAASAPGGTPDLLSGVRAIDGSTSSLALSFVTAPGDSVTETIIVPGLQIDPASVHVYSGEGTPSSPDDQPIELFEPDIDIDLTPDGTTLTVSGPDFVAVTYETNAPIPPGAIDSAVVRDGAAAPPLVEVLGQAGVEEYVEFETAALLDGLQGKDNVDDWAENVDLSTLPVVFLDEDAVCDTANACDHGEDGSGCREHACDLDVDGQARMFAVIIKNIAGSGSAWAWTGCGFIARACDPLIPDEQRSVLTSVSGMEWGGAVRTRPAFVVGGYADADMRLELLVYQWSLDANGNVIAGSGVLAGGDVAPIDSASDHWVPFICDGDLEGDSSTPDQSFTMIEDHLYLIYVRLSVAGLALGWTAADADYLDSQDGPSTICVSGCGLDHDDEDTFWGARWSSLSIDFTNSTTGQPSLYVDSTDFTVEPDEVIQGAPITVTLTTHNHGTGNAIDVPIRIEDNGSVVGDDDGDTYTTILPVVARCSEKLYEITYCSNGPPGPHPIAAEVDPPLPLLPNGTVAESCDPACLHTATETITVLPAPTRAVVLVLDKSGSMEEEIIPGWTKIALSKSMAHAYVDQTSAQEVMGQPQGDANGVINFPIPFECLLERTLPLTYADTQGKLDAHSAINVDPLPLPLRFSRIYDGIDLALDEICCIDPPSLKFVVVFTDGEDNCSTATLTEVLAKATDCLIELCLIEPDGDFVDIEELGVPDPLPVSLDPQREALRALAIQSGGCLLEVPVDTEAAELELIAAQVLDAHSGPVLALPVGQPPVALGELSQRAGALNIVFDEGTFVPGAFGVVAPAGVTFSGIPEVEFANGLAQGGPTTVAGATLTIRPVPGPAPPRGRITVGGMEGIGLNVLGGPPGAINLTVLVGAPPPVTVATATLETTVMDVTPPIGFNDAPVEIAIDGLNFDGNVLSVELVNEADTVFLVNVERIDSTRIDAQVPPGAKPGLYHVVVHTTSGPPNETSLTLYHVVDAAPPCSSCPTDVDGNGQTGAFDLANLLGAWGPVSPDSACLDADSDGSISAFDLAVLLGAWGPCP